MSRGNGILFIFILTWFFFMRFCVIFLNSPKVQFLWNHRSPLKTPSAGFFPSRRGSNPRWGPASQAPYSVEVIIFFFKNRMTPIFHSSTQVNRIVSMNIFPKKFLIQNSCNFKSVVFFGCSVLHVPQCKRMVLQPPAGFDLMDVELWIFLFNAFWTSS